MSFYSYGEVAPPTRYFGQGLGGAIAADTRNAYARVRLGRQGLGRRYTGVSQVTLGWRLTAVTP